MGLARRGFLAGTAAALAGCAPTPTASSPATPTAATAQPTPSAPSPSPTPSPTGSSPTPSPEPPALPTTSEIETQYAGRAPQQWGLEVDGVVLRSASESVALTFDACGGPNGSGLDEALIDFLIAEEIPATLFLNSRWIDANPQTTRDLIATSLFSIGNHGTRHVPLSVSGQEAYGIPGTASIGEVYDEIMGNQLLLTELMGEAPRFFRPGTAFFDEVAAQIVRDLGLIPVNFDINADAGATFSAAQVSRATQAATPGSICIAHFNRPASDTAAGMARALPALRDTGIVFATLDDVVLT